MSSNSMTAQPQIKKTPVLLVLLLIVVTAGIYIPIWFLKRRRALNSLDAPEKLEKGVFIFVIIAFSTSLLLDLFVLEEGNPAGRLINLIGTIAIVFQCFAVRRILDCQFNAVLEQDIYFSGILTFFLGILYLQYMINRLPFDKVTNDQPAVFGYCTA